MRTEPSADGILRRLVSFRRFLSPLEIRAIRRAMQLAL
jgi:Xaa-Pro aminopeptidase